MKRIILTALLFCVVAVAQTVQPGGGGGGGGGTIPSTTSTLKGDGAGNAAAVTGTSTNCVLVNGTSAACGVSGSTGQAVICSGTNVCSGSSDLMNSAGVSLTANVPVSSSAFSVQGSGVSPAYGIYSFSAVGLGIVSNVDFDFSNQSGTRFARLKASGDFLIGGITDANFRFDVQKSGSAGTARFFDQTATTGTTKVTISKGAADTAATNTLQLDASLSAVNSTLSGAAIFSLAATLQFKSGSNARVGTGTLSGGTLAVANTSITANSYILIQDTGGGIAANIGSLYVASQTAGTGFTVTSSNAIDTSTFKYWIFETN